jgi:uridine kinase
MDQPDHLESGDRLGGPRARVLAELAALVLGVKRPHPVRVGIDGWSAAGKTTLAGELAAAIIAAGRPAVLASLDDFKTALVRRGRYPMGSAQEYYYEMYDYPAIRAELLEPVGPGGSRAFRQAIFDQQRQAELPVVRETATDDTIVLAEGAFLFRPELNDLWDFRVFVDIGFDQVLERGSRRDSAWMDSLAAAEERYRTRYIPSEQLYLEAVRPHHHADVVVDNRDLDHPRLSVRGR